MILEKIVIVLVVVSLGLSEEFSAKEHSEVFILQKGELDEWVKEKNHFVLIIDNNQHPYSKAEMIKLADLIKISRPEVEVARIRYDDWIPNTTNLQKQIHINQNSNFPMAYLLDEGFPVKYQNDIRSYTKIRDWVVSYLSPSIQYIQKQQLETLPRPFFVIRSNDPQKINIVMRVKSLHHLKVQIFCLKENNSMDKLILYRQNEKEREYHGKFVIRSLLMWLQNAQSKAVTYIENLHDMHLVTGHQAKVALLFYISEENGDTLDDQIKSLNYLCEKWSHQIKCGQLSQNSNIGTFLYMRLRVKKGNNFISLFRDHTKISYLFKKKVHELSLNPESQNSYDQDLQNFIQNVIENKEEPFYDFSVPDSIEYEQDVKLTPQEFYTEINQHTNFFVKFYHKNQYNSKQAFRSYQKFRSVVEDKYDIQTGAIDCHQYHEFCQDVKIQTYPRFVLFVNKIPIYFGNHNERVTPENLLEFVDKKINREVEIVKKMDQVTHENALIFEGEKLIENITVFAKSYHLLPIYFLQMPPDYYKFKLYLKICGEVIQHTNKIVYINHDEIVSWMEHEQSIRLKDLSLYELKHFEEELPVFLLLILEHSEQLELIEGIIGTLCNRLSIKCRMILTSYTNYPKVARMLKLPIHPQKQQSLFYINTLTSQSLEFTHFPLSQIEFLNETELKSFIEKSSKKKLSELPEIASSYKSKHLDDL